MTPELAGEPSLTLSELYLSSCAPQSRENAVFCEQCHEVTTHQEQSRVLSAPNVLLMQVRRTPGRERVPVHVDEQLDVPGLPTMDLTGVVYHAGARANSGHYTCI